MRQQRFRLMCMSLNYDAYVRALIRDEIYRRGLTLPRAAVIFGISKATLDRILNNDEYPISPIRQRGIEGGLGFPRHLIEHVLNGDAEWIARLPDSGIDPDLRRAILEAFRGGTNPNNQSRTG